MSGSRKVKSGIGEELRRLLRECKLPVKQIADILEVSLVTVHDSCSERGGLSPALASRLPRLGIDGRALFLKQAANTLAYYEAIEARAQRKEMAKREIEVRLARAG